MSNTPKLVVLRIFEPFFGLLTCTNASNFKNPKTRTRNVAKVTLLAVFWPTYAYTMLTDLWHCYGLSFDLRVIAFPFAIFINGTQLMLTYASLRKNAEPMRQTVSMLAKMVDTREFISEQYRYRIFQLLAGRSDNRSMSSLSPNERMRSVARVT